MRLHGDLLHHVVLKGVANNLPGLFAIGTNGRVSNGRGQARAGSQRARLVFRRLGVEVKVK